MFKNRTVAETLEAASKAFPVLLLTGPRGVGKAALLKFCAETGRNYVTLDDIDQREIAKNDPALFLQLNKPPVIIDEVQYVPELFNAIKIAVDRARRPGMFWLTGSQKFHLMQGITETLAGRIAIIDMLGLSQAEIDDRAYTASPFLPIQDWIQNARNATRLDLMQVYKNIWRGSYPEIVMNPDMPRDLFYNSYIQTYITRDVRALTNVGNEYAFYRFLRAVAARTGQLINYSDLSRDVDVDSKTVKSWLGILETSGIVYLLHPYHNNLTNRLIKTPKVYFLDTGLCSYITQWSTPEALEAGAFSGAILETYIFSEILKSYWHNGLRPYCYFYRDKDQKEIDLLIEQDNVLYPIEFKKTATPSKTAWQHFTVLEKLKKEVGAGAIICLRESDVALSKNVHAIPVSYL